jgi:hypothetical protein
MENSKNSQRMIQEAIRKIALGHSLERISMSAAGTGGVGNIIAGKATFAAESNRITALLTDDGFNFLSMRR